jgi:hypothetical protein
MILYKYRNTQIADHLEKLTPGSWIWRNFLSKEEVKKVTDDMVPRGQKQIWTSDVLTTYKDRLMSSFYGGDFSLSGDFERIVEYIGPEVGMGPHVDVLTQHHEVIENMLLTDDEAKDVEHRTATFCGYGLVVYLSDNFEGGELYYPEYDVLYKPNAGDLVIHDAETIHCVRGVKSGRRLTHQAVLDIKWNVDAKKYGEWEKENFIGQETTLYVDRITNEYEGKRIANKRLIELKKTFKNDYNYW